MLGGFLSLSASGLALGADPIRVVVWDEQQPQQKSAYGNFLGNAIADHLAKQPGLKVKSVRLDDPEQGISDAILDECDVLIWWGHVRNGEVKPERARKIVERIKAGKLSLIALHSAHWSSPFIEAMNERSRIDARNFVRADLPPEKIRIEETPARPFTPPKRTDPLTPSFKTDARADGITAILLKLPNCCFPAYRADGKPSHVRVLVPNHPICRGIPEKFDIPRTEMYDDPFHVPPPDEALFEETWDAGRAFPVGADLENRVGARLLFPAGPRDLPGLQAGRAAEDPGKRGGMAREFSDRIEAKMRVSIIGGGGLVGSCAAYALQCGGVVSGIDLLDLNADLCRGQALDLLHGSALAADQRIRSGGYELIPESDLICITAGLRRKPDESRLDLINRNVELFLNILSQVKAAKYKKDAIVLVVSNPVDVLTYLATMQLGLPSSQVISLGTQLDSSRFRGLIADSLKLPPTQVTATILGEHGDSMVPIWSAAQAAGLPLEKFPGWTSGTADALFAKTKGSGAEVIKLKGGAGFAVGLAIADVIHSIALDRKRILPVGSLVSGTYGIRDVCLSVPSVVGRKGVESQLEIDLWPKEVSALQHSGQVLRETIDLVLKKNPTAAKSDVPRAAPEPKANGQGSRVTMGSGGHAAGGGSSRVTISGQTGGGRRG